MSRAAVLLLASSALLLAAATASERAGIEAGEGDGLALPLPSLDVLTDRMENLMNLATEQAADVPQDMADANVLAWLELLKWSEGTGRQADPYRVCYGYSYTIADLSEHPSVKRADGSREWPGLRLADAMCQNAGFAPGCVSTAAGAYQITRGTWVGARDALGLPDFSPASQDRAAVYLTQKRGALQDVRAGRLGDAVAKCRNEWASLPGNYARQGQRSLSELIVQFQSAGGNLA